MYVQYANELFKQYNVNFKSKSVDLNFPKKLIYDSVKSMPNYLQRKLHVIKNLFRYYIIKTGNKNQFGMEYDFYINQINLSILNKFGYGKKGKNHKALIIDKSIDELLKLKMNLKKRKNKIPK